MTLLSPLQYLLIFASLIITPDFLHGFQAKSVIDSPLLTEKIGTKAVVVVDPNGKGDFESIQAAIDYVPGGNSHWIIIHVKKGVYREQVHIPHNKPYIFMRGDGRGRTVIVWSHSSGDSHNSSATFRVEAPHFIAYGISFKNGGPTGMGHTSSQNQSSVAAMVAADKAAFYSCGFISSHNTLFDYKGRHYYDHCYIQGSMDSIFGQGLSMFHLSIGEAVFKRQRNTRDVHGATRRYHFQHPNRKDRLPSCEIFVIADRRSEIHSSVTAQHRNSAKEKSGFVFVDGKVYGVGDVYLGRAKGAYSRVVFANTYLSRTVTSQGWTNRNHTGHTKNLHHAEYKCHGPGSNTKNRAHWSKQLNEEEASAFLSIAFIQGKEWLPAWI